MNFRTLKADEIDVKVGNVTAKGYTLLLYKNARVDMNILDETVGAENWQRDHKEVKGNLYCGIGINVNYQIPILGQDNGMPVYPQEKWVWKWDCGVESQFGDKEKGEASDSFKRAGVNWGIGRELYTSPVIFVPCKTEKQDRGYKIADDDEKFRKFVVSHITYNDKREIDELIIQDTKGVVVYPANTKQPKQAVKSTPETEVIVGKNYIFSGGKYQGKTIGEVMALDEQYLDYCLKSEKVSKTIKDNIMEAIKK